MHFWHTSEMKNVFERNFSPVKFGHVSMRPIFELMTCCAIVQWVDILSERNGILLPKLLPKFLPKFLPKLLPKLFRPSVRNGILLP